MKLKDLKGRGGVTVQDITGAEDYPQVRQALNDDTLAVSACIMLLRGSADSLEEACSQITQQARVTAASASELVGKARMTWVPSGPSSKGGDNQFVKLLMGKGSFDPSDITMTINCWESVLLAAMLAGVFVSTTPLASIYQESPERYGKELRSAIADGARQVYNPASLLGRPVVGDVVIFSAATDAGGLDHVVLATGRSIAGAPVGAFVAYPGSQVINFWPAPRMDNFGPGTPTTVENTTIEGINAWVNHFTPWQLQVTFGSPKWSTLAQ